MNLSWIPYVLLLILNNIAWYFIVKYAVKSLIPTSLLRMARQGITMVRQGREDKKIRVKASTDVMKLRESGKAKITEALPKIIPGAEILKAIGLTDNELFSLVSDQEFMQSIMKILNFAQTLGQGLGGILNRDKNRARARDRMKQVS